MESHTHTQTHKHKHTNRTNKKLSCRKETARRFVSLNIC